MAKIRSGKYWVTWANANAKNSSNINDLAEPFRTNVKVFIAALEAAGARVTVTATRRDAKRAYLFHWCWLIGLGKVNPSQAKPMIGVDIEWNHGDLKKSRSAAKEMIAGFGLAVPPKSTDAPSLNSNHIAGNAIDMDMIWSGKLRVKKRDGSTVEVDYISNPNANTKLHQVGASYNVRKRVTDAPHWSNNGG